MKDYIRKRNNLKKYAAVKKWKADIKMNVSKVRTEMFLVQELKTSISYLEEIFKVDISNINDDEIKSRKDEMPKHVQQLDNLNKKCRIYLNVPIQYLNIKLKILLEATIISKNLRMYTNKQSKMK